MADQQADGRDAGCAVSTGCSLERPGSLVSAVRRSFPGPAGASDRSLAAMILANISLLYLTLILGSLRMPP
jgi:hypothetical protein